MTEIPGSLPPRALVQEKVKQTETPAPVEKAKTVEKTMAPAEAELIKSLQAPPPSIAKPDPQEMVQQMHEVVARLNSQMEMNGRTLGFQVDAKTGRQIVSVTDKNTGELIRQIPGDEVLKFAHNLENIKGLLHNKSS